MSNGRFTYCSHSETFHVAEDRPLITPKLMGLACQRVQQMKSIAWASTTERFEAEQPDVVRLLASVQASLDKTTNSILQTLTLGIWLAFREQYPGLQPVRWDELAAVSAEFAKRFLSPPTCFCSQHQGLAIKATIEELEGRIDRKELPETGAIVVIQLMASIIETLDRAAKQIPSQASNQGTAREGEERKSKPMNGKNTTTEL